MWRRQVNAAMGDQEQFPPVALSLQASRVERNRARLALADILPAERDAQQDVAVSCRIIT